MNKRMTVVDPHAEPGWTPTGPEASKGLDRDRDLFTDTGRYDCCGMSRRLTIDHDELLTIETNPTVLMDLLGRVVTWEEVDWVHEGFLPPSWFEEFVAQHNWTDPARLYRLAVVIGDAWRSHRNDHAARELIATTRTALATYDKDKR